MHLERSEKGMDFFMKIEENDLQKSIGRRIKLARLNLNYTQSDLAEKVDLSTRYISQLERGIAFGSANTIVQICKALKISPDFLLYDLIKNPSYNLSDMVDIKFLENFLKLSSQNQDIIKKLRINR